MSALTYATAQLLRVLPRARVGRALGRLADHTWHPSLGRAVVGLYSRAYDVELDDCAQIDGWTSFDAFFTRGLRAGTRPIDPDKSVIVSPADGVVDSMGAINDVDVDTTFHIKGRPYRVEELVGDEAEARRYKGGSGCVIYLSPRDYHRVHSPVDGHVTRVRSLPGEYFPVNSIGVEHVPNLFAINRRVAIEIETTTMGRVTVVMVAAIVVGRITVSGIDARDVPMGDRVFDPPRPVQRGEEIGVFHLGSTAVVFFEKKTVDTWLAPAGKVRFGQSLARAPLPPASRAHKNGASPAGMPTPEGHR